MRGVRYGLIVLVIGTVAACTSDADPQSSDTPSTPPSSTVTSNPPPTPTASPSPSVATTGPNVRPGEKPPVLPALAKTNSRPGAAAFAYYWFQALDWGYATTDSTLAKNLYVSGCSVCAGFIKDVDDARTKDQHFRGGRITLKRRDLVSGDNRHPGTTVVDVFFDSGAVETLSASGQVVDRGKGINNLRWRIWLSWTAGKWAVTDMRRLVVR